MTEVFNIENRRKEATRRYVLHIVFIFLLILGAIAGLVLSLLFSKLDYLVNLLVNIILSALLIAFILFYFFNIFPIIRYYFKLYRNINEVAIEKRRNLKFEEEKEMRTINNVKHRVLEFSYKEGEDEYKENLYILDSDIAFEQYKHYRVESYRNVIVRFEEINNATNQ